MPDNDVDLLEVLNEQLAVVNELIELGLAETEAFKIDDVEKISFVVDQQKVAVGRMRVLEQRKADILSGVGTGRLAMEALDGTRLEVENAISCLVEQVRRLQQVNETNRLLARMSLSYSRMMQKALGLVNNSSYDEKGMPSNYIKCVGNLNISA